MGHVFYNHWYDLIKWGEQQEKAAAVAAAATKVASATPSSVPEAPFTDAKALKSFMQDVIYKPNEPMEKMLPLLMAFWKLESQEELMSLPSVVNSGQVKGGRWGKVGGGGFGLPSFGSTNLDLRLSTTQPRSAPSLQPGFPTLPLCPWTTSMSLSTMC